MADFTPEEVDLVLTWDGDWITQTLHPTYTVREPNGPRCPPRCRRSLEHITLPVP
jgi:hypothetical protein